MKHLLLIFKQNFADGWAALKGLLSSIVAGSILLVVIAWMFFMGAAAAIILSLIPYAVTRLITMWASL